MAKQEVVAPATPPPSAEDVMRWVVSGVCQTTDGCWVDPDGYCQHGKPSWLIVIRMYDTAGRWDV